MERDEKRVILDLGIYLPFLYLLYVDLYMTKNIILVFTLYLTKVLVYQIHFDVFGKK